MLTIEQVLLQISALVVDNNFEDQSMLATQLQGLGAKEVLRASTGIEALTLLKGRAQPLDMILAEVRIPDGNGLQLLQAIRCGQAKCMRPNSTFVLTTAAPAIGIIQTASALDANGFVVKPVKGEKLEPAILKARRTIFPPNFARHSEVFIPEKF
ncbi:MAG: response regulator [Rhodospirillaceae bacterium]|nr:response regulator [Rhodospirillaceae bacterium]